MQMSGASGGLLIAKHRRKYEQPTSQKLEHGRGQAFEFDRFQSAAAIKAAFSQCRSAASFKEHVGEDGRKGHVCSTKLGGDWVLAESEQIARSCTTEQVLRAYLTAELQRKWNADKVASVRFTRKAASPGGGGGGKYYQQDIKLHSQRIIRSHTGPMSYSQKITVDKVGAHNYCAHVQLDPSCAATARKPFESLAVYVGLQQRGDDVHIYAAGVFEVNRRVVPNLVVFDASGIAGNMAGKGTLWLAGHFEERRIAAEAARRGAGDDSRSGGLASRWIGRAQDRLRAAAAREQSRW